MTSKTKVKTKVHNKRFDETDEFKRVPVGRRTCLIKKMGKNDGFRRHLMV